MGIHKSPREREIEYIVLDGCGVVTRMGRTKLGGIVWKPNIVEAS